MIKMNASITHYQEGVGKERTKERSIVGEKRAIRREGERGRAREIAGERAIGSERDK